MGDFFVRIDDLAEYTASFMSMAGSSESELASRLSALGNLADCWGADAAGSAFLAAYEPVATDTLGYAMQMPTQLSTLAAAMGLTYQAYSGTEATNTTLSTGVTNA
jgi:hypothetical protein